LGKNNIFPIRAGPKSLLRRKGNVVLRYLLWQFVFNRSVLAIFEMARLKKLKSLCWWLLRCVSGAGEWGARGAGVPPRGRGASIFLGGGDPSQPAICVSLIRKLPLLK
jgi:hypothetical protein